MKTKRLISMILTCVMLVAAFTGITVFAAEETDAPSVEIVSKNIYFGETINLMYAVKAENADGCELELTVLAPDGKTYGVEKMEQVIERDGVECPTFKAKKGEAAQNINKVYTATATLTKDGEVVAKDVVTYSVLEYIFERKPMTTDPNEIAMLDALKAYAAAADKVINKDAPNNIDQYVYVTVAGATEALTGIYKAGDKLSLVPDVEITADMTAYWIVNGEQKSLEEMADYTIAGETTISLYTSLHVCADENGDFKCDDADETGCTKVVPPAADSTLTLAQANALGKLYASNTYTEEKYYVEGTITEFYNNGITHGNVYITDGTDTFLIYGISKDGVRYDALDVKPVPGDTIKVYGIIGAYGTNAQAKSTELIEHTAHVCEDNAVVDKAVEATCTATGLTEGSHCGLCNKVLVEQTKIDKLAHTFVDGVCGVCGEAADAPAKEEYTVTMKYSTATTTNMTGKNDAAKLGLDESLFTVTGNKGGNTNLPGLNKSGQIRLYYGAGNNGNILTVSINDGTIKSIVIKTGGTMGTIAVKIGDSTDAVKTFSDKNASIAVDVNDSSFSLQNVHALNTQCYILSIEITYEK